MTDVETIYDGILGGLDLVAWFGRVPAFHDAEIVSLNLRRRAPSLIAVHAWNTTQEVDAKGHFILDRHAVVTFALEDIVDLELAGFSQQNVLFGLHLRRAPLRPHRPRFNFLDPSSDDYEIELEPCYGLHGIIRCRKVSVHVFPGKPDDLRQ